MWLLVLVDGLGGKNTYYQAWQLEFTSQNAHGEKREQTLTSTYMLWNVHPHIYMCSLTHRYAPTHMHVLAHTQVCTHTFTCTRSHTDVHPHICMHLLIHRCAPTHIHALTHTQVCTHTYTRVRSHTGMCPYIYMHLLTHVCANTSTCASLHKHKIIKYNKFLIFYILFLFRLVYFICMCTTRMPSAQGSLRRQLWIPWNEN